MPLPLLFIGIAVASGMFGVGCVICGTAVVRVMQLPIGQYAVRIGKKMK